MRLAPGLVLALLALAGAAAASGATRQDAGRTGASEGAVPPPLHAWVFERARGPPVAGPGTVYTLADPLDADPSSHPGSRGIHLVALRASDGRVLWETPLYGASAMAASFQAERTVGMTPPTLAGGLLVLLDTEGQVWALHAGDGSLAWRIQAGAALRLRGGASPLVVGHQLYLLAVPQEPGSVAPALQSIDLQTQAVTWSAPAVWRNRESPVEVPPLSSDGQRIFFVSPPAALGCGRRRLRRTPTGPSRWRRVGGSSHPGAPSARRAMPRFGLPRTMRR
ncbi:MAG TPA: PQQ-binding-like beta-propeller repeat protein [Candidatus Thermoplasmatota archaeon]|nr:PQQ-binding-like beta-propeller repeat protein [Candidatus Thermoplasmatota archaeon]